jgi:hypothetical protein
LSAAVQRHRQVAYIDLRQHSPERLYCLVDVAALAEALHFELGKLVGLGRLINARRFLLEKPAPRMCGGAFDGMFKDGLHFREPVMRCYTTPLFSYLFI